MATWKPQVVVLASLSGCAFAPADVGPPEPTISNRMRNYADFEQDFCRAWPYSEKCTQERRHLEQLAAQQQTQVAIKRSADRQAAAAREAMGSAMVGDGAHSGQGWWCYSGTYGAAQGFGRCVRGIEACADRLVARVEDGMKPRQTQCEQQESATCFSTVHAASGRVGNYCFPDSRMCGHFEEQTRSKDPSTAVTSCTPYI